MLIFSGVHRMHALQYRQVSATCKGVACMILSISFRILIQGRATVYCFVISMCEGDSLWYYRWIHPSFHSYEPANPPCLENSCHSSLTLVQRKLTLHARANLGAFSDSASIEPSGTYLYILMVHLADCYLILLNFK